MTAIIQELGRRKTAVAVVKVKEGTGIITINGKTIDDYFGNNIVPKTNAISPLIITNLKQKLDAEIKVTGGGLSGQGDAIKLALARSIVEYKPELKSVLKKNEMLKRDPRMVERKKSGQPKARKKFQWTKR